MLENQSFPSATERACINKNVSNLICCSPNCQQQNPLICGSENCSCDTQLHTNCSRKKIKQLKDSIVRKKKTIPREIAKKVSNFNKNIDEMINNLSKMKQYIIQEIQNYGLGKMQAEFLKWTERQSQATLSGKFIAEMSHEKNKFQSMHFRTLFEPIDRYRNSILTGIQLMNQNCKIFNCFWGQKGFKSVLTRKQQILSKMIEQSTNKNIKQYVLKFRASQYYHSIDKFHEKCDNIPNTVVLIQTQFEKIIGGFTPIPWQSQYRQVHESSKSPETFLFSLTMEEKFIKNDYSPYDVQHSIKLGTAFGKNDLRIKESGNGRHSKCSSNFPVYFNRQNKKQLNGSGILKDFTGISLSTDFIVKEYEVFQVVFN